ncbi:hypothetical protein BDP55DRAFT_667402 [Colletotrichum godetiae]|uniref:Uncharacterized protein n=1 Tax=Colletotrichum godetiae TaxID=1209918 RepID=A0AAJ0AMC4_9PEZI|nr:uncharacterized protein BDP55DRAFT_667402 [Colletotrichum godetiae]KAK1674356.1 hypothetical protein BDP55DRAFT_667402 [Colletotrichum godetiae]
MVSLSLLAPSKVASALVLALGLADICNAAVQCDIITSSNCGKAKHHMGHKLPTNVGGTYYVDGFHGGVMNAKFQSMTNSVPGNSQYVDLTYNFNLGNFDQAYWILLPTSFGGANECFAVYKNCDVTIRFWDKKDPLPNWYTLA